MNVYESCPQLSSERFLLRQTLPEDRDDLLKVYSDTAAVPIFNSDNCTGDFYMTRPEDMASCIAFWLAEYGQRYYVRWSVLDRGTAIGTIELFHRTAQDFYNHVGLLRLDLRSDYETQPVISELVALVRDQLLPLFDCTAMATKAPAIAQARIAALESLGFTRRPELLYGHDGRGYGDYYLYQP